MERGTTGKESMDFLSGMRRKHKDKSAGRHGTVSSAHLLPQMQERVSCKCKTIQNADRKRTVRRFTGKGQSIGKGTDRYI